MNYPFIFGARGGGGSSTPPDPLPVRWDYIEATETQYIGFGNASTTNLNISELMFPQKLNYFSSKNNLSNIFLCYKIFLSRKY